MQQIFEQLMQGFAPKTTEIYRKKAAQRRKESLRLLRALKSECSEKHFTEICEMKRLNREYCREDLKNMFSEGVLYGILAGLETACGFPEGKSLLASLLYGNFADERHRISSEKSRVLLQKFDAQYNKAEKDLNTEQFLRVNDIIDNEAADIYSYTEAYYAEGMRKGILLGVAAGELAKTLPLV